MFGGGRALENTFGPVPHPASKRSWMAFRESNPQDLRNYLKPVPVLGKKVLTNKFSPLLWFSHRDLLVCGKAPMKKFVYCLAVKEQL
jgi:hypothetical protein